MSVNWKSVGEFVMWTGRVVAGAIMIDVAKRGLETVTEGDNPTGEYSEAVEAIMRSDMFSSEKHKVISALPCTKGTGFYKAIISIASDSSMFSSDKVKTILKLCGEE